MSNVVFKVVDNIEIIKTERQRLKGLLKEYPENASHLWDWMIRWLAKSDKKHLADVDNCYYCNVCGATPRYIIHADFSFCDEYDCGISFCKECVENLYKLTSEVKQ